MKFCLAYWLGNSILLHFGFYLFIDVLCFETPSSFVALHSGKSALPH